MTPPAAVGATTRDAGTGRRPAGVGVAPGVLLRDAPDVAGRDAGALLFARYAYPPNALGLCGPDDAAGLLERAHADEDDGGLLTLARAFEGAWPYLAFVAGVLGIRDPLDARVVRAYWLGSPALAGTRPADLASHLDERFRRRAGPGSAHVAAAVARGALPTHDCHVLAVSPWTGLLRGPHADVALATLDDCRIRVGRLLGPDDDGHATVTTTTLSMDAAGRLGEQACTAEVRTADPHGRRLAPALVPGDLVAVHWGWACDRLTRKAAEQARSSTRLALALQP